MNLFSLESTKKFSPLVLDYINEDEKLKFFYNRYPSFSNFKKQIEEKKTQSIERSVLFDVLKHQNANVQLTSSSLKNLNNLKKQNTFTVTTGHQLCLFSGPLYFIYKIISTINLAEKLKKEFSDYNFVPVFWMASEDHDFEEINHINLFGKKIQWDSKQTGPVGRMKLDGMDIVLDELKSYIGSSNNANKLIEIFNNAYLSCNNIADATREVVNSLFGEYGLLILDGDDASLKKMMYNIIKQDVEESKFYNILKKTSSDLSKNYKVQARVNKINFFELVDSSRIRIETNKSISSPIETYSPNVLLRPIFQEIIMPNIAYVGGGAEIAYWMQLKGVFEKEKIVFPILVLRNSCLILDEKKTARIEKLNLELKDIFLENDDLQKKYIKSISVNDLALNKEKDDVKKVYDLLLERFNDAGIESSIKAEQTKNLNALDKLSKKITRLEKKKNLLELTQISNLKEQLFPFNKLQERHDNFISYYIKYGENFIKKLKKDLNPLEPKFVVLTFKQEEDE